MFVSNNFVSNGRYLPHPRRIVVNPYYYGIEEGLGGIGSFFKKLGINLGRLFSGGLWDPGKNRFFVPFSSGHMRTLGKGFIGTGTLGLVNSDKFFDTRTMRTIGTIAGITAGVATGAAVGAMGGLSAVGAKLGTIGSQVGSVLPSLGTVKSIAQVGASGMQILGPLLQKQSGMQVEQPMIQEVVQSGYPTVVSPVSMYPPYYYDPRYQQPYVQNPFVQRAYYEYDTQGNIIGPIQSPSVQPTIEEVRVRREFLPGGVEIFAVSGYDSDTVDTFGKPVYYR